MKEYWLHSDELELLIPYLESQNIRFEEDSIAGEPFISVFGTRKTIKGIKRYAKKKKIFLISENPASIISLIYRVI